MSAVDVDALQRDFSLADGQVYLPPEPLASWRARLAQLPAAQQEQAAVDLLAVAAKFQRRAPDASAVIVLELCDLAAGLIADGARAEALAKGAGVDVKAAAAVVGAESSAKPVGASGRPAGTSSPLSLRLQAMSEAAALRLERKKRQQEEDG